MDKDEMVPIYWPVDYLEADSIKQALEQKAISCFIEGENIVSCSGCGPFGNVGRWRMRLFVKCKDAERAKDIIEAQEWPRYA